MLFEIKHVLQQAVGAVVFVGKVALSNTSERIHGLHIAYLEICSLNDAWSPAAPLLTSSCILYIGLLGSHRSNILKKSWWCHSCVWPLCLYFIKINVLAPSCVYVSTTVTYARSCSFMYLGVSCYFSTCLRLAPSTLRVGVKPLYNTNSKISN